MRLLTTLVLLACFSWRATLADGLPDLGDSSQSSMSTQQERQLGESVMRQFRASENFVRDPDVSQYLNTLGYKLASNSQDPTIPFEFFALKDRSINAFALPGGFVGIHTGLLLTAQSESELASVLGHEISHVTQHHLARQMELQSRLTLPMLAAFALAILAAQRSSSGDTPVAAIASAQALGASAQLGYSRDNEREADRLGMQTLEKSGFDPRAMPRFFERMQKATMALDNNAFAYLRTHPLTTERIADTQARVDLLPYKQVPDSPDFSLVREKIRVLQMGPKAAIQYYKYTIDERKFSTEAAAHFGYAVALMEDRQYDKALAEAAKAQAQLTHPYIDELIGDTQLEAGRTKEAEHIYTEALARYPDVLGLFYGQVEALLRLNRPKPALDSINQRLNLASSDPGLYHLQARAYSMLNDTAHEHRALAEANWYSGNPHEALTQLRIAHQAAKGDFYLQSSIEARQREIQAVVKEMDKGQNRQKPQQ